MTLHTASITEIIECFRTPLHWAAATGQVEAVSALLDLNVDPNAVDLEGGTPLEYARQSGHQGRLPSVIGCTILPHQGRNSIQPLTLIPALTASPLLTLGKQVLLHILTISIGSQCMNIE